MFGGGGGCRVIPDISAWWHHVAKIADLQAHNASHLLSSTVSLCSSLVNHGYSKNNCGGVEEAENWTSGECRYSIGRRNNTVLKCNETGKVSS